MAGNPNKFKVSKPLFFMREIREVDGQGTVGALPW